MTIERISSCYRGDGIASLLSPKGRRAFLANLSQMTANYGESVDAQLLREQILLCDETASVLYEAPAAPVYVRGSRPELEKAAADATAGTKSETEMVLALCRYCSALWQRAKGRILFYGGREEELIRKGEQLCECLARLLCALSTVSGLPSRIVTHIASGHLTSEVFADGRWCYLDPRKNLYFTDEKGHIASALQLWHDHTLFDKQPKYVKSALSPRFSWEETVKRCHEMYFHPNEIITFKYYDLSDARYRYDWSTNDDLIDRGIDACIAEYDEAQCEIFGLPPTDRQRQVLFSLAEGQPLRSPLPVSVYLGGMTVLPYRVLLALDGRPFPHTDGTVPTEHIHNAVYGVWFLGGEGYVLDPRELSPGEHTILFRAEIAKEDTIEKELHFTVEKGASES